MIELEREEVIKLIKDQLSKTNFDFLDNDELEYLLLQVGIGCDPEAPYFGQSLKLNRLKN
jgi:hypothetical protein